MGDDTRPVFVSQNLFGGRGTVRVQELLAQQKATSIASVLACELEPGGSVGTHVQQQYDEVVIFNAGIGSAEVNGQARDVGPGVVLALPCGATLMLNNPGPDALQYYIVKAVPAVESP